MGRRLLLGACAVGLVHAGFSLYWALGGWWLLNTVGQWAVQWAEQAPVAARLALTGVAAVKIAGAAVPLLVDAGRLPWRRFWRTVSALGAGVLIVYGAGNTLVAWAVLSGLITVAGGFDPAAQLGHAALWDPLFFLWGALLAAGLWATRRRDSAATAATTRGVEALNEA